VTQILMVQGMDSNQDDHIHNNLFKKLQIDNDFMFYMEIKRFLGKLGNMHDRRKEEKIEKAKMK